MIHFWQYHRCSIENTATFFTQTCLLGTTCARMWDQGLQDAARPICIMPSYDVARGNEMNDAGNPPYNELPEWNPLGCSYYQAK